MHPVHGQFTRTISKSKAPRPRLLLYQFASNANGRKTEKEIYDSDDVYPKQKTPRFWERRPHRPQCNPILPPAGHRFSEQSSQELRWSPQRNSLFRARKFFRFAQHFCSHTDVPLQVEHFVGVAATIRVSVRVRGGPITIKTYILPRASQETRFMNSRWSRTKLLSRKIGYVRQSVETFLEAPAASCMEYLRKQIWIPVGDIDCSLSFDERRR